MTSTYILTAACDDAPGIVAAVANFVTESGGNILESRQHDDRESGRFFVRVAFTDAAIATLPPLDAIRAKFDDVARRFAMDWAITDAAVKPRILIAVSKLGHCLNDLLYRWRIGALPVEIVGVVSNHSDFRALVEWHGLPFHHLPITPETKAEQEAQFLALVERGHVDLVVLARYMQILSDRMASALSWRCINIHHSFLPSFKGARPYHQAHARGVRLIGATAHYVTADLDEGPIIEQDVERVASHLASDDWVEIGRDIEARVLARAVKWHAERKILPHGQRTVVLH